MIDKISFLFERSFRLDSNTVIVEKVPLVLQEAKPLMFERVEVKGQGRIIEG
jgi:hypothetical protein